ncbi:MAG TPA: group 1 truncated hemoglobin [Bryobacteraceae bacterium]|nr:group 1 truncated hemoglobin [Bryobacteraceae bacterium]
MRKLMTTVVFAGVLALSAVPSAFADDSLYKSLGGKKAITAVVGEFVGRVAGDSRINGFFKATAADPKRMAKFKANLVDQICEATGGPCKYKGKSMKEAHKGMGISSADFTALVEDLKGALDKFHVKDEDQQKLLGALGGMKGDIVEKM